ncbi:NnrU family protein [Teichococcus vastitatis]|uniref:NnrU family protein n=1 Tax=Teichococcus vastitatis TaxID=2307076 RepID=A0ABS9W4Y8_9PROT|nr:NnrU family protein [Pseudoroseomonas vastitatis]
MQGQLVLVSAALFWVALHAGLAGSPLRWRLVGRLGENGFRGLFSLLSALGLTWLIMAYRSVPTVPLWNGAPALHGLAVAGMLPVFLLFAGSLTRPNPTAAGGETRLPGNPQGMQRITRHPMLNAFALWAALHLLANGDSASVIFFGSILATALLGMPSIDRKLAHRRLREWAALRDRTSALPFGAILAGRNRLVLREIGVLTPGLGLLGWILLLLAHPWLFGVPALPG